MHLFVMQWMPFLMENDMKKDFMHILTLEQLDREDIVDGLRDNKEAFKVLEAIKYFITLEKQHKKLLAIVNECIAYHQNWADETRDINLPRSEKQQKRADKLTAILSEIIENK